MAQTLFTTANLDIALTKVRDGCAIEYTGSHQEFFEFQRLLLVTGSDSQSWRKPERRRIARRHCFLRAEIWVPGRRSVPCLITDVSSAGAGLILGESLPLPDEVDLHIWKSIVAPVVIRWRKALNLGVEFRVDPHRDDPGP